MENTYIANVKPVEEFVSYIRTRFQRINKNWWEIALAFAEAREMYGTGSKHFKDLCKLTSFSESTITKLISIVSSERVKKYAVQLSSVHSWGTLYAISSLTDEQFNKLKEEYKLDDPKTLAPFITQAAVEKFKKEAVERSVFKGYAVIQVDDEAVKGGLLTGTEFEELQKLLAKIETLSSYVAVKRVGNDEKEELSRLSRIENKVQQLIRKHYLEGINAKLERYPQFNNEKKWVYEKRVLGLNRDELMADFQSDAASAFNYLGLELDMANFYRKAELEVSTAELTRADKYAKKVLSRPAVLKEPVYNEEEAWEEVRQQFARKKEKQQARQEKLINALKDVA